MTELTKFADKVMPGFNGGGRAASGASATNTSANGATTATTASGDPTP
jgi:hypothetical protein